jgi:hypothetical protein
LRLSFQLGERFGATDGDQQIARFDVRVAGRIEDHLAIVTAHGDDDDIEFRADVREAQLVSDVGEAGEMSTSSKLRSRSSAAMESMKSATAGFINACTMRWLPMMVGAITRFAPARINFGSACSSTARATICN